MQVAQNDKVIPMNNPSALNRYIVDLVISGVNWSSDPCADQEFDSEIKVRPYLENLGLSWDVAKREIHARFFVAGPNKKVVGGHLAKELFMIASAVLNDIEGVQVEVIRVTR